MEDTLEGAEANLCKLREIEDTKSRRSSVEEELRAVHASMVDVERRIQAIKEAKGWYVKLGKRKLANNVHANAWRSIVTSGSIPGLSPTNLAVATQSRGPGPGRGGRGGRGGVKRGRDSSGSASVRNNAKRARQPSGKEKRVESLWGQCGTILNAVKRHRFSWPFLEAVDPVALNIPDYFTVVSKPMDLGTISKKLEQDSARGLDRRYSTPMEFRDDMRQVWANCRAYNRPGQDVRIMGDFLSEMWEKKWCQSEVEEKWKAEQDGNAQVAFPESPFIAAPIKKPRKQHLEMDREMAFPEKRRVAQLIGSLNGEQLAGIVEILLTDRQTQQQQQQQQQSHPPLGDEELELDLDKVDSRTLWKMKHYMDGLNSRRKGKHPRKKSGSSVGRAVDANGEMLSSQMNGTPSMADTEDDGISDVSLGLNPN
ncbi:hypothetical protein BSKO_14067 [Bryopsis sp. KO-2023]|nr:hypothetical protein BSKO_14067 [Bryopsis sp. KO-2023]